MVKNSLGKTILRKQNNFEKTYCIFRLTVTDFPPIPQLFIQNFLKQFRDTFDELGFLFQCYSIVSHFDVNVGHNSFELRVSCFEFLVELRTHGPRVTLKIFERSTYVWITRLVLGLLD